MIYIYIYGLAFVGKKIPRFCTTQETLTVSPFPPSHGSLRAPNLWTDCSMLWKRSTHAGGLPQLNRCCWPLVIVNIFFCWFNRKEVIQDEVPIPSAPRGVAFWGSCSPSLAAFSEGEGSTPLVSSAKHFPKHSELHCWWHHWKLHWRSRGRSHRARGTSVVHAS